MNTTETLKWGEFKEQLQLQPALHLQFKYAGNKFVGAAYHITEIKQAPITSVDCGGVIDKWTEVIVQLWEPSEQQQERAMVVGKALSIIDLVEKLLPLDKEAVVKIEFGNAAFDARQMYPSDINVEGENLVVNLTADKTQCKAINRGGSCGTDDKGEECCQPAKPKVKLINLAAEAACCTPGGGCC
ncbi:DUF6428 family protein [Mucilaginibacter gilvus]|uniref:Uncharacterized protein n=1 Tax=Mucilaginibacter gilvus TaxID=2305909 RepID=A0A3S3W7Q8_9SPHI|nr:DUF6428 family protein [Mucilaginibacter gilvus]RWY50345.1 hypothetical protein EPL05_16520 [Mucilaginibacter gilvus]